MSKVIFFIFLLFSINVVSQTNIQGIVVDSEDKSPIEFVDIYNSEIYTFSNENGKFFLKSAGDEMTFKILGYRQKNLKIQELINNDTIYLEPDSYELDEVVITNDNPIALKMFKNISENYQLEPFKEKFFLRSVLKKNHEILELQDIYGIVSRKVLLATSKNPRPKNNFAFRVEQMRKAGVKDKIIDVETPGIENLFDKFVQIYASPKVYKYKNKISKDSSTIKLLFEGKDREQISTTGYYIMNTNDKAFAEVYISNPNPNPNPSKVGKVTYQTTLYELRVWFSKDKVLNRYHINKARLNLNMKVILEDGKIDSYASSFILHSNPLHSKEVIKNNIPLKKDLFNVKSQFNEDFWKNQNTLKLSDEMLKFIKGLKEIKEYKTISNFN